MKRQCLACGRRPAATMPEWPALCEPCLDRAGERIKPGARVVCTVDLGCSGTVDRLEDHLAIVRNEDTREAWVPIVELVRVDRR